MYAHLMRKLAGRATGTANAKVYTLPAPVGGWNARDSLSAMKPEDAIILDNIIPDQGRVRLRDGYGTFATGMTDPVETLMEYAPPDGANKLFGATETAIWDVTSAGAAVSQVTSLTSARWQHVMMATIAGNFLCCVNGADGYHTYDGATWTDQDANILVDDGLGGTEVFGSDRFIHINIHANRLWFVEKDSLDAWYLPVASITGEVAQFPLGPLCKLGGSLLAIATWTKDAGDGMDDLICFITDKGEVVVYQGTDPDSATDWALVGVYRISEPIGRRCSIKVGGDLGVMTSTGVSLMSKMISTNTSGHKSSSITAKITRAFADVYALSGDNFGWQIQEFPAQGLILINVPSVEHEISYQYVMNVATGQWCRFTGINALCWSLKGSELFFGGIDGKVYQYGRDRDDDGEPIRWLLQMAYNSVGGNNNKVYRMARILLVTAENYTPGVSLSFNYDTEPPSPPYESATSDGALWDEALWDEALWTAKTVETNEWQSVEGVGRSVSVAMAGASFAVPFEFNQIDIMLEEGSWL